MLITNKTGFLHIPKTGGIWVRDTLRQTSIYKKECGHPHDFYSNIKYNNKHKLKIFCFVRHPVSWFISHWAHWKDNPQRKERNIKKMKAGVDLYQKYSKDFVDFLRIDDLKKSINIFCIKYRGWMIKFYEDYTKDCDFIGKQENLREDLLFFLQKAGEKLTKKDIELIKNYNKKNISSSRNTILTKEQIALITESQKEVLKKYNYSIFPGEK